MKKYQDGFDIGMERGIKQERDRIVGIIKQRFLDIYAVMDIDCAIQICCVLDDLVKKIQEEE